jgi:hypothetical protein
MEKDLFETLDLVPQEVRNIIEKYEEAGANYKMCQNLIKELEQVGYTCDFGLDGVPYELKQLSKTDSMLEVEEPIEDLKGRALKVGDLVVLANADHLYIGGTEHAAGEIFQFVGGLEDNIGAFTKCKTNERIAFFADRTLKINKKLNLMENHWNSYGVFAIALQLKNQNFSAIDVMWQEAIDLYKQFYKSEWDDQNQSELECINKFMKHINQ